MLECDDGTVSVKIKGGPKDGESLTIDLILLQKFIAESEAECPNTLLTDEQARRLENYKEGEEYYTASSGFLCALRDRIRDECGYCTPTIANHLWVKYAEITEALKKNTETTAESAFSMDATPPL